MKAMSYIWWETLSPVGGRQATVARWGGDRTPSLHTPPARDLFANSKKNYIKVLAPGAGDRGHFRNFSKWTYIFKFFIFLEYKKEKDALQKASRVSRPA